MRSPTRFLKWRWPNPATALLLGPLLVAVLLLFGLPLAMLLHKSLLHDGFSRNMPRLSAWFVQHPAPAMPDAAAWFALEGDLRDAARGQHLGKVARRLNRGHAGSYALVMQTGRALASPTSQGPDMPALNAAWADPALWAEMRRAARPYSAISYLRAFDLGRDAQGRIRPLSDQERVYLPLMLRSVALTGAVTLVTLVLSYPLAAWIAARGALGQLLGLGVVLASAWTALLARVVGWMSLLQHNGAVNDALVWLSGGDEAARLGLLYNATGALIVLVHMALPLMVLSLLAVMRRVDHRLLHAAQSLGAGPVRVFWRVYLPQTYGGIAAGMALVAMTTLGAYIVPALLGGATGQMFAGAIAVQMTDTLDWQLASALSVLLIAAVGLIGGAGALAYRAWARGRA